MINYTSLVVSIINPNYYLNRVDKSILFSCIFFQYVNELSILNLVQNLLNLRLSSI